MPLPVLLYPLLYLPLIKPLGGMRGDNVGSGVLGVGRDGAQGGVGVFAQIIAFGEAGFDFEDGISEEDRFLLEACEHLFRTDVRDCFTFGRYGINVELTLRTTFTFAAPDPSLGATASTTRRISLCIMRTKSRWFSR